MQVSKIKLKDDGNSIEVAVEGKGIDLIALMVKAFEKSDSFKEMAEIALMYVNKNDKEDDKK